MTEAMSAAPASPSPFAGSEWFDPLEEAVRLQVRGFIEELLQEELEAALGRGRYERGEAAKGHRHGRRPRQLVTTFGPLELSVPRARLHDGTDEREWKSDGISFAFPTVTVAGGSEAQTAAAAKQGIELMKPSAA